jgi:hypothetical protein
MGEEKRRRSRHTINVHFGNLAGPTISRAPDRCTVHTRFALHLNQTAVLHEPFFPSSPVERVPARTQTLYLISTKRPDQLSVEHTPDAL